MNPVRAAIYTLLTGDAELTALLSATDAVYYRVAPPTAATPFVVFSKQAGTRTWLMQGGELANAVWQVKAVDRGPSASRAETIDARIDALLDNADLSLSEGTALFLRRESDVDYGEQDQAETYHHVGGMYRLVTEPA